MLVFEFKTYGKALQFQAIDEAIRTTQFIRNKAIRLWMDGLAKSWIELSRHCALLAKEFPFANKLNSMARQAAAERAWAAISRFYDNCKKKISGKKGFPQFQKNCHSVEYKSSGWKLAQDRKSITFTDKNGIGKLKLKGTRELHFYQINQIKRVRLVKRADGVYAQFCVDVNRKELIEPTHRTVGLDVGLESFYTDSFGQHVENPRFYRTGERKMKRSQRLVSRKVKGSNNRRKARNTLGRVHLKISRQRKDHAVKLARCVITSNDAVVYEDLRIKNMVKNHCLAKSISDAGWYQFRVWLEYFGKVFKRITIAANPSYTSQKCSNCGVIVKKSLSTRTHVCQCGCVMDRDENAAKNILNLGLGTVGHIGTSTLDVGNALGESTSTLVGVIQSVQVDS
ncbi:RNA-guided endonuclease InsQ/TnpB family protein [Brunnivagina elsteri]|uniref:Transposase n=1 Tax=Brunnivagina elsteri CCALA 953 TaxID=987040 RepID=A0A2A2TNF3_9CYAN|nr:RNA-guided endonuclease TnpB family protein [Calothrix elsteri]PAX59937.1 transposase [Calothrix elsteri CCALA 953]